MSSTDSNNQESKAKPTPEIKSFLDRNKIIAIISTFVVGIVIAGYTYFEKYTDNTPKSTPTEMPSNTGNGDTVNPPETKDISNDNSSDIVDTDKQEPQKPKEAAVYNPKTDPNTSYKNCPDPKADSCMIEYHDPGSGAVIATMPNQGSEKGMNNINTVVTGLDRFTEIGIQKAQREKLWKDFINYGASQDKKIKEISVTVASIKKINTESDGSNSINFEITTDRVNKLASKIIYSGSKDLELKIFNPEDNTQLYDSAH